MAFALFSCHIPTSYQVWAHDAKRLLCQSALFSSLSSISVLPGVRFHCHSFTSHWLSSFTPGIFIVWSIDLNSVRKPGPPQLAASLPWFQVKPGLCFLLLQCITACLPIYRVNSNHYLGRWRSEVTGVGLNFGWILKSPWELKNNPVCGATPKNPWRWGLGIIIFF